MGKKDIDPGKIQVRPMAERDLEAIVAIDTMYFGTSRPEYYQEKLAAATKGAGINTWLVAEADGEVLGFIMGALYTGEFGIPETAPRYSTPSECIPTREARESLPSSWNSSPTRCGSSV